MTEVLFVLSIIFVVYFIYVLVDEQLTTSNSPVGQLAPENPAVIIKQVTARPSHKKTKVKPTAIASSGTNVPQLVGMAAGVVWKYLNKNGPISVAKLIRELPEDQKTIQRSIGWLAQEDKITLDIIDRAETIALKE